jgi:hypothetical protein
VCALRGQSASMISIPPGRRRLAVSPPTQD